MLNSLLQAGPGDSSISIITKYFIIFLLSILTIILCVIYNIYIYNERQTRAFNI